MNDTVQVWSSAGVVALCAIAAIIVVPYAARELWRDRSRLRGQFAAALVILFAGISSRIGEALIFYFTYSPDRVSMLKTLHPWILSSNGLIAIGALLCIRLVTVNKSGEGTWLAALVAAAVLAFVVAL